MTVEYAPAGQLEGNNTPMQEPAYQGMLDLLATTKPKSKTEGLNYTQKSKSFFKKKMFLVVSTVKERYILDFWMGDSFVATVCMVRQPNPGRSQDVKCN